MGEPTYEELVGADVAEDEALEENAKLMAHDVFHRLKASFAPPAYITLEEVRDATGFDGQRTADAMAISLYRSRGKCLWGFEIKISRNDWLKELKQPEKAESIMRYCHHWALIVPDKDIVKPGELPSTWGMYVATKNRLKCVVPAPTLEPIPMSMTMFTALIYAVSNRQSKADEAALRAAKDAGYQEGVKRVPDDKYESKYNELKERCDAYEKASGLSIQYGWHKAEKIGNAVSALLAADSSIKDTIRQAQMGVQQADRIKEALEKQAEVLQNYLNGKITPDEDD